MAKPYDPYVYVDLTALRGDQIESDGDEVSADDPDAKPSCAGKVLLLVSGRGMEVVHVPTVTH